MLPNSIQKSFAVPFAKQQQYCKSCFAFEQQYGLSCGLQVTSLFTLHLDVAVGVFSRNQETTAVLMF